VQLWENALVRIGLEITLILLVGIVVRWGIVRLIKRLVRQASRQRTIRNPLRRRAIGLATAWAGARGEQRAAALGSLAISVTTLVVSALVIFSIVAALGYNLTPLFASAGVVGVALGFGAQNLVKDLIAGVGMLVEDQLGVGDEVDMDKASGVVEAVGLRVTRLRDSAGTVWYVRNGEVLRVGNKSQGWSQIVLDIDVAYDTDLEQAKQVVGELARQVAAEPAHAAVIIDPPAVVGVEQVTSSGVTIRVLGTCRTGQNAAIERELRVLIKEAFDRAGIRLAAPAAG
jgi:small conductance mechanosensitive channel